MSIIFINNQYVSDEEPVLYSQDRGFLIGDGMFETMKAVNGEIKFFDEHWMRFSVNAKFLQIPLLMGKVEIKNHILYLLKANQLTSQDAAIRITLSRGRGTRGIRIPLNMQPTCLITVTPYHTEKKSIRLWISSWKKYEDSPLTQIKSTNRLENILAYDEAIQAGYDDALFLNTKNNLTETTTANFFLVQNDEIFTPTLEDGILPGVMRTQLIECAKRLGIKITEGTIPLEKLHHASEIFISNVLMGAISVIQINQLNFIDAGPIFTRLVHEFF